jgi:hypothetical protein
VLAQQAGGFAVIANCGSDMQEIVTPREMWCEIENRREEND